jgi:GTP pyrophosphokinase
LLSDELTMLGLPAYPHEVVAAQLGYPEPDLLYRDLGRAELLPTQLATQIAALLWHTWPAVKTGTEVTVGDEETFLIAHAEGHELRLCRACQPQPGSRIVGFLRADERVTVHRPSCHKLRLDPLGGRTLKLEWADESMADVRIVTIELDAHDRVGLLHEITELMLAERINIVHFGMPREGRLKHLVFDLAVSSPRLLVRILHQVFALTNVASVHCVLREQPAPAALPAPEAPLNRAE